MLGELDAADIHVKRIGFSRASAVKKPVDGVDLGEVKNGQVLRRLLTYLKAVRRIRTLSSSADVLVAFGSDLTLLATAALIGTRNRPIVTFISDIPSHVDGGPLTGRLVRLLERLAFSRSRLIVVTSEHFIHGYVNQISPGRDWVEVRNIPSPFPDQLPSPSSRARITIGYFGLIRCRWSLEVLTELVRRHPDRFEVVVAGIDMLKIDLPRYCANHDITYLGTYRSPEDLDQLYACIDIVWTAYPFDSGRRNAELAKTNRFFEAACYGLPQIGNAGTLEGANILSAGVGLVLQFGAPGDAVESIAGNSVEDWAEIRLRAHAFRSSIPSLCEEIAPLTQEIRKMAGSQ